MLNSDVKTPQPITMARSPNAYRIYCHLPLESRHRVFQTHVCQCSEFVLSASRSFRALYQVSTSKIYKPGLKYHTATYRYDPRLHNQQYIVLNGVSNLHLSSLPKPADFIFYFFSEGDRVPFDVMKSKTRRHNREWLSQAFPSHTSKNHSG